jgi:hypothetical protein
MTDYIVKRIGTDDTIAKISDPAFLAMTLAYSCDELCVTYNKKPIFTHNIVDMGRKWNRAIQIDVQCVFPYMTEYIARWDRIYSHDVTNNMCINRLAKWIDNKSEAFYYPR